MKTKKILSATVFLLCGLILQAQTTYVPDDNFEQALIDLGYDDVLDDYVLTSNISGVGYLDIIGENIGDLTGIEDFISLGNLDCSYNQLTSLDVSQNVALTLLYCHGNQLASLDVSQNTDLVTLWCKDNQLTSIDVTQNIALRTLFCHNNQLTSLDVSQNIALTLLYCHGNQLTSLDVTQNTDLTRLVCEWNQLTSLDIGQNTALTYLNCYANQLAILDLTQATSLTYLKCRYNQLTSLDVGQNIALEQLDCSLNQLTSLDVTQNIALIDLNCNGTHQLTSLDVSQNIALKQLDCSNNELMSLDVSQNIALEQLDFSSNELALLDVRNGNNLYLLNVNLTNNPSLTCIQVDNETDANAGEYPYTFWQKDDLASYSEDCYTYIPDNNFEQALIDYGYDDVIDGYVLRSNISGVTTLNVPNKNIADITGIEDFIGLTYLNCNSNQLTSLDVSQNIALTYLNCNSNQLTSLDVTQNIALIDLFCQGNQLTSLDVTQNIALTDLNCYSNQLTSLDVSQNTVLTLLLCGTNQLTSLDVSQNTVLEVLGCMNNPPLTSLDIRNGSNSLISNLYAINNPSLTCIQVDDETLANDGQPPYNTWQKDAIANYSEDCETSTFIYIPDQNFEQALIDLGIDSDGTINQRILRSEAEGVKTLNVSNPTANPNLPNVIGEIADLTGIESFINLTGLSCGDNQLVFLDVSNAVDLVYLYCEDNQLSNLDVSQNTNLKYLYCYYNQLSNLDISQNTELIKLRCYNNQLTSLDVSFNTGLTELACLSNQISSLDVAQNTFLLKLNCEDNLITSLDLSQNLALVELWCGANPISNLDVSLNIDLVKLSCYSNNLTSLNITQNTHLETLLCGWNDIISLDLSENIQLSTLGCWSNQLTELDMRNGNNTSVTGFNVSSNNLSCINVDDETADHSNWVTDDGVIFSNDCSYNTQAGDKVFVSMYDQDFISIVEYESVTESGNTTMVTGETGPEIPGGFSFGDPVTYFDIETSASYSGAIQVAIFFGSMTYNQEDELRILHYETDHWVDVTTMVDIDANMIYGEVFSLSPFVVVENLPPVAICSDIITVADANCEAEVEPGLIDNGSYDPGGDVLTYSVSPVGPYPLGISSVILTVTNEDGLSDDCEATVTVNDELAPVIAMESDPVNMDIVIWPPNHKYQTFILADFITSVTDNCSSLIVDDVNIIKATSDEPEDAEGEGDGNTLDDIIISSDCKSVQLRKERSGNGNGRVYNIHFELEDGNGNTGTATCQVQVPQNNGGTAIDDGPIYEEFGNCENKWTFLADDNQFMVKVYPNPLTTSTTIEYELTHPETVIITFYNQCGKQVDVIEAKQQKGLNKVVWTPEYLTDGIYYFRLETGEEVASGKVVLVR